MGEVVATPLSAFLMSKNPWIPYFIYSVLTILGGMVPLLLLPETLRKTSPEAETLSRDTGPDDERHAEVDSTPPIPTHSAMALRLRPLVKRNVIAVPLAFFVSALGRQSTSFLLQYIRQRFNWKYEKARALIMAIIPVWCSALTNRGTFYPQASLLITVRAAINLALLLVALPALNRVLVKRKMSAQGKDLLISRLSLAFFAVGSLVISAAPIVALAALGIAIFALGYGFAPAARSLGPGCNTIYRRTRCRPPTYSILSMGPQPWS